LCGKPEKRRKQVVTSNMKRELKSSVRPSARSLLVAYLQYAVDEVAELSPSSASLLVAAIDGLQEEKSIRPLGNDVRKPS